MFKELNNLRVFLENSNREFNTREVARILKVSPANISEKLKQFSKKGILLERKERILNLYKANLESEEFKDIKIFYNIRKLRESGLIETLNKFYLKPTIVVFGSYSKGFDIGDSDIDLLIVSENNKIIGNLGKFEKKLNREIHIFAVKNIKELKNNYLINNVLNGITIQGSLKWT